MKVAEWNGGSGKYRDKKGRARTRFHFVGEYGLTYCRIKIPFDNDEAEVEIRPSSLIFSSSQSRICDKCLQVAGKA